MRVLPLQCIPQGSLPHSLLQEEISGAGGEGFPCQCLLFDSSKVLCVPLGSHGHSPFLSILQHFQGLSQPCPLLVPLLACSSILKALPTLFN